MFVLTIDQQGSQQTFDRVPLLITLLKDLPMQVAFERSVGDEVQGIMLSAEAVVEATLRCLRDGYWYVGIGVGGVDAPFPPSPREGRGSAFVAARKAVERAKRTGYRSPLAIEGPDGVTEAEGVLDLLGRLVAARSEAEWRILDLLEPGVRGTQTAVARSLGITPQAVSKAAARAAWYEEQSVRPAAARLLAWADSGVRV